MRPTLTVPEIDSRLAARRARGVKPTLYDRRLIERRARIQADAEHEAYREAKARALAAAAPRDAAGGFLLPAREVRPEVEAAVEVFLEAAAELMVVAPAVTEEAGADLAEMLFNLATWWPPASREEDAAQEIENET